MDTPAAGFDTIGNATIICHDGAPVLVTDPWLGGNAYFGSWGLSHRIPDEQRQAIETCPYVWFSHGHPDHLNADSLPHFRDRTVLLPDHAGGRVKGDLLAGGYRVQVLPDNVWTRLSRKIQVLCISDYNQDAILLIDINGRLLVNRNDAGDRGTGSLIRKLIKRYETSFLLALSGYGDADMINFFDEQGHRVPPMAAHRLPVGKEIQRLTESYGTRYFIPFSSMHRYQRTDSAWANQYVTQLHDYPLGFASTTSELLPAFLRYDCERDTYAKIDPQQEPEQALPPEHFGDNWNELLEKDEIQLARTYFQSIEHLGTFLDHVHLRIGGKDHVIEFRKDRFRRGVTFEAPRHSLVSAMKYQVFDDVLIGNFVRTTLHGDWPRSGLYPDFTPYVAKYADNGMARTAEELDGYFKEYQRRMGLLNRVKHLFEERSKDIFRRYVSPDSPAFQLSKRAYWTVKRVVR